MLRPILEHSCSHGDCTDEHESRMADKRLGPGHIGEGAGGPGQPDEQGYAVYPNPEHRAQAGEALMRRGEEPLWFAAVTTFFITLASMVASGMFR